MHTAQHAGRCRLGARASGFVYSLQLYSAIILIGSSGQTLVSQGQGSGPTRRESVT